MTGVGYAPEGRFEHEGASSEPGRCSEHIVVLSGGSLAGNADLRESASGEWEIHGDPTEAASWWPSASWAHRAARAALRRIGEIPFTSDRKMMSTIELDHEHDDEVVVITKGAPDVLLERCNRARVGMEVVALDDALRARILADVHTLSDAALRTLAVAYRPLAPGEDRSGECSNET